MLVWGLFGLLYCLLIPGLGVVALASIRLSAPSLLAIALGLSLLLNHLTVIILFLMRNYNSPVVTTLAILTTLGTTILVGFRVRQEVRTSQAPALQATSMFVRICGGVLFVATCYHLIRALVDFGHIFVQWDAVVSYNRWAVDWTRQSLPKGAYDYPQLIPSVWSLSYLLLGDETIQVFSKSIVACLPIAAMLGFFGVWDEERSVTGVVGAICYTTLLYPLKALAISGYVEFPTATLAFIGYFAAWLASRRSGREAYCLVLIGAAIAAGAGVCKQGGLYYAIFHPLFVYLLVVDKRRGRSMAILACVVVLPILALSYGLRFILGLSSEPASVAPYLMFTIHGQATALQKVQHSIYLLNSKWLTPALLMPMGILWLCSLWTRFGRILTLGCAVPPLVIYILFFGYDVRNALFCLPFLAWAAGHGFSSVVGTLSEYNHLPMIKCLNCSSQSSSVLLPRNAFTIALWSSAEFVVLFTMASIIYARGVPAEKFFHENQTRLLREIGFKYLNSELLAWIAREKVSGKILTNYTMLAYIPETKDLYAPPADPPGFSGIVQDIERFRAEYVLDINPPNSASASELSLLVAAGKLSLVREVPAWWRLYRVCF